MSRRLPRAPAAAPAAQLEYCYTSTEGRPTEAEQEAKYVAWAVWGRDSGMLSCAVAGRKGPDAHMARRVATFLT
eukprot:2291443-Alexandrium_andersonii.AAC.1